MATTIKQAVVITTFHKAIADAITKGDKAALTMAASIRAAITTRYGGIMPTHAEYSADQDALGQLAKARKLADNQHYRKVYAKAINEIYGALPIALTDEANKKRAQREKEWGTDQRVAALAAEADAKKAGKKDHEIAALRAAAAADAKPKKQATAGAPAGQPKDQAPSATESLEQMIARVGVPAALEAISHILESEVATRTAAKTLATIAKQVSGKAA